MSRKIDLSQLQPQQLVEVRKVTEDEINHFTQSLQALQTAQSKLKDCINSIDSIGRSKSDNLLIPMTSSLYLPGQIKNKSEFLVDIGTGYFAEKLSEEAKVSFEKKITKLTGDASKLKEILAQKNDVLNSITMTLRAKVIQMEKDQNLKPDA